VLASEEQTHRDGEAASCAAARRQAEVASLFRRARALKRASLGVPAATERESDRRSRIDGQREAEARVSRRGLIDGESKN